MPRKPNFKKRELQKDPKFGSTNVGTFINRMMLDGKKSLSEKLIYQAFDLISGKIKDKKPLEVFTTAVENVAPVVKVKARRIGGATYQVPEPVTKEKGMALAHRWIIQSARKRSGKSFPQKLANELLDAHDMKGKSIDLKESTHRMAEANKAFAHYART
jgi:small subunit ribosomal protein S7